MKALVKDNRILIWHPRQSEPLETLLAQGWVVID